jgi:hypothetical protein
VWQAAKRNDQELEAYRKEILEHERQVKLKEM